MTEITGYVKDPESTSRLLEPEVLNLFQLHLVDTVFDANYTKSEQQFLGFVRQAINKDFAFNDYEISSINNDAYYEDSSLNEFGAYRSSIQFPLKSKELEDSLFNLKKTPDEVTEFLNRATEKGDLINTQGVDGEIGVRFQDPRQHDLKGKGYIGFDFDYKKPKTETTKTFDKLYKEINQLKDKVKELEELTETTTTTSTTSANPEETSTTTSTTSQETEEVKNEDQQQG